jgi:hypothetical protein
MGTRRSKRGGAHAQAHEVHLKAPRHELKYIVIDYDELPTWATRHKNNVANIETLATTKGWAGFTVADDIIANGIYSRPYVLFGLSLSLIIFFARSFFSVARECFCRSR